MVDLGAITVTEPRVVMYDVEILKVRSVGFECLTFSLNPTLSDEVPCRTQIQEPSAGWKPTLLRAGNRHIVAGFSQAYREVKDNAFKAAVSTLMKLCRGRHRNERSRNEQDSNLASPRPFKCDRLGNISNN